MEQIGLVTSIVSLVASIVGLVTTIVTALKVLPGRNEKNPPPSQQEKDSKNKS